MKPRFKIEQVAEALRKSAGIQAGAARILGCTRASVCQYVARYPQLARVADEAIEFNLDLAETKLIDAVNQGEMTAIKFYLETKGKSRNYTRRHEVTGANGGAIEVTGARDRLIATLDEMAANLAAGGGELGSLTSRTPDPGNQRPNGAGEPAEETTQRH
jgi:hypothetical protein